MRILLTGATGFIGRALVPALLGGGHQLVAWTRSAERARNLLGADVEVLPTSAADHALAAELGRCDAVINFAGEPIIGRRWTAARKVQLTESRVGTTARLVRACAAAPRLPAVLISGSAVGYYGNRGTEALTEQAAQGEGFLADLAAQWEAAARPATGLGMRVVLLRTGIVLGREGGALVPMRAAFQVGLGGPMGPGTQFVPWIHLHDVVRIVCTALVDPRYDGPLNMAAPEETTSRQFASALGDALERPSILPAPSVALRVALGEAASALLDSQRVQPRRLLAQGFQFTYPTLAAALADIVGDAGVQIGPLETAPAGERRRG